MNDVILTLSGNGTAIVADLYENERISLSMMFTDISEFKVKGGYSREFNIPASDRNVQFFGDIFSPNVDTWFDYRTKVNAVLSVNTIPIAIGHVQIKGVVKHDGRPQDIKIVFFSEVPDISRAIADKKLKDINDLSTLNHDLEYATLTASVAGTLESGNVIYTLIDRGQKWSEEGTGRPIFDSANPLYIGDLTPSVNALWIWQKIIADAGFYYTGATVDTELERWWIPWVNSKDIKTTVTPDDAFFKVGRTTDLTGLTNGFNQITGLSESYDNGANFASDTFTAPYTGTFTFSWYAHFTRTSGSGTDVVQVMLLKNTTDYFSTGTKIVTSGATNSLFGSPYQIFLQAGDTVKMFANIAGGTYTFEGDAGYDENVGTGFSCVAAGYPVQDATVSMVLNAPDMKQIDFIKAVIAMMNLAVISDKDSVNNLLVEPLGDYIGSGDTLDWTGKLDISKDIQIYPTNEMQRRNLKFTYKEDGDALNAYYRDNAGRVYGQFEIRDTGNDFASGEQLTQVEFRPTPCNLIGGTNVIIPKFVNQQGEFFAAGPRVLYQTGSVEGVQVYNFDTTTVTATEVLLLNHYSDTPALVESDDLNWGAETPLHPISANPYNTLYNRYYRTYLREIYGGLGANDLFDQALIMEAHFNLSIVDVSKLSFADQIFIQDSYWRILEVNDYQVGQDETTRVKLIKILDVALECDYVPSAIGTGGQVVFHDADGNDVDGSQECCELYGYVWNSAVSKCYSQGSPGGPVRPNGTGSPGEPTQVPGAFLTATTNVDDTYYMTESDYTVFADTSSRSFTIYLPDATQNIGRVVEVIKVASGNTLTIDGNGTNINGAATHSMTSHFSKHAFQSNGKQWYIMSS